MFGNIVDASLATAQTFALIGAIIFALGAVIAIVNRTGPGAVTAIITFGGLFCVAMALMFLT